MVQKVTHEITPAHRVLIDFIVKTEAAGNWNAYFGHSGSKDPDLAKMNLAELQKWMVNRGTPKSSATGGPQFMSYTLFGKPGAPGIVEQMGMSMDTLFTVGTQEQLCAHLLIYRGFDYWARGAITDAQFGNNLAFEWASFPRWSPYRNAKGRTIQPGQSAYAGDGLNKALVSLQTMQGILVTCRRALAGADAATVTKPEEPEEGGEELGRPDVPPPAAQPPASPAAAPSSPPATGAPLTSPVMAWFQAELLPTLMSGLVAWLGNR